MISIKNLKLLEDLKEEHESIKNKLENLKEHKSEKLYEAAVIMLRRIQKYLENNLLSVTENNSEWEDGFVANYKKGYLRGVVKKQSNSINIIYQGETLEVINVIPRPTRTINVGQSNAIEKDILESQIESVQLEKQKLEDEVKSYNQDNFVFTVEVDNKTVILQKDDEVLAHLFK